MGCCVYADEIWKRGLVVSVLYNTPHAFVPETSPIMPLVLGNGAENAIQGLPQSDSDRLLEWDEDAIEFSPTPPVLRPQLGLH